MIRMRTGIKKRGIRSSRRRVIKIVGMMPPSRRIRQQTPRVEG
jgi:hypothetical protein